jgi:hypothetical protein
MNNVLSFNIVAELGQGVESNGCSKGQGQSLAVALALCYTCGCPGLLLHRIKRGITHELPLRYLYSFSFSLNTIHYVQVQKLTVCDVIGGRASGIASIYCRAESLVSWGANRCALPFLSPVFLLQEVPPAKTSAHAGGAKPLVSHHICKEPGQSLAVVLASYVILRP